MEAWILAWPASVDSSKSSWKQILRPHRQLLTQLQIDLHWRQSSVTCIFVHEYGSYHRGCLGGCTLFFAIKLPCSGTRQNVQCICSLKMEIERPKVFMSANRNPHSEWRQLSIRMCVCVCVSNEYKTTCGVAIWFIVWPVGYTAMLRQWRRNSEHSTRKGHRHIKDLNLCSYRYLTTYGNVRWIYCVSYVKITMDTLKKWFLPSKASRSSLAHPASYEVGTMKYVVRSSSKFS